MKQEPIIFSVLIAIWWQSLVNGMPTLTGSLHKSDRSASYRLRRQTDYSPDDTVVVEAPEIYHDAYAVPDDPSDDGNLTLRFGYGGHQHYNPFQYGGWHAYGGGTGQPDPHNNFPGGYPVYPYGPYNYHYPETNNTTMNPFYNNNYHYGFYYPTTTSSSTTTTSTTTRPTTTTSTTTTRPPYGNYYVFNFRDGSGNHTETDNGTYAGGDVGQDDGFNFGNR